MNKDPYPRDQLPGTPGILRASLQAGDFDRSDRRDLERRLDEQERLEREADKTRVRVYQFGSRVTKFDNALWSIEPGGTLLTIFDERAPTGHRLACYATWDSVEGPCAENPPPPDPRERYGPA